MLVLLLILRTSAPNKTTRVSRCCRQMLPHAARDYKHARGKCIEQTTGLRHSDGLRLFFRASVCRVQCRSRLLSGHSIHFDKLAYTGGRNSDGLTSERKGRRSCLKINSIS